jgi:uncharacterized protein YoaH (UPF0181 family)
MKNTVVEKIYIAMEGFATKDEIDEEIIELTADGYSSEEAINILIANIDDWACYHNSDARIVLERMELLGIEIARAKQSTAERGV